MLDLFSRKMLGYAMSEHHDAELAVASLRMAAANRGGTVDGVIFHSDRGSEEYTAETFEAACRRLGGWYATRSSVGENPATEVQHGPARR